MYDVCFLQKLWIEIWNSVMFVRLYLFSVCVHACMWVCMCVRVCSSSTMDAQNDSVQYMNLLQGWSNISSRRKVTLSACMGAGNKKTTEDCGITSKNHISQTARIPEWQLWCRIDSGKGEWHAQSFILALYTKKWFSSKINNRWISQSITWKLFSHKT